MPADHALPAQKRIARAAAAAARDRAFARPDSNARASRANAHLQAFLHGVLGARSGESVLAGYMAMRSELDPLATMRAHPGPVCVPVISARATPLRFRAWSDGAPMVPGPFGAAVPARGAWMEPSVVLVPLLAFDAEGYRLGYGGGFYDRTLAVLRAQSDAPVLAIGLGFAMQRIAAVPRDALDARLDALVTEDGVVDLRGACNEG